MLRKAEIEHTLTFSIHSEMLSALWLPRNSLAARPTSLSWNQLRPIHVAVKEIYSMFVAAVRSVWTARKGLLHPS